MATKTETITEKKITPCEPMAEFRTPAAIAAANRGETNYVVVVAKRYSSDKSRYIKVDDNPDVIIPTEEEVEVAANEYYELKRSATLRKENNKRIDKIVRETNDNGAAL